MNPEPDPIHDDLAARVHEAVQNEILLLAKEIGMEPYGAIFRNVVNAVTASVEKALLKGDDSLIGVQRLIDSVRGANNPNGPKRKRRGV